MACLLFTMTSQAQTELKFNAASSLLLIPNVGIEVKLKEHVTLQLDVLGSFWNSFAGKPLHITQIFNEVRYYSKSNMRGYYIGGHVGFGMFTLQKWGKSEGSYQSGRNYYIGVTVGYKKTLNKNWALEFFLGGGTSQAYYRGYDASGTTKDRNFFNKSGESLPYRGGVMLVYVLH